MSLLLPSSCDSRSQKILDVSHPSIYNFASTHDQASLAPPRYLAPIGVPSEEDRKEPEQEICVRRRRPIPTNKWWGNLIHQTPGYNSSSNINNNSNNSNSGEPIQPVWAHPYAVRVIPGKGLAVTYSFDHRHIGPSGKYYYHGIVDDIVLAADDLPEGMVVEDWDDFGVTVGLGIVGTTKKEQQQQQQQQQQHSMVSHLVSGMAFVTATFDHSTPSIESVHALVSINGRAPGEASGKYQVGPGSKTLLLEYNSGQHWAIFSDRPITLKFDENRLVATSPVQETTTLRVAKIDDPSIHQQQLELLDRCASTVVLGGSVEILSDKRYNLKWKTATKTIVTSNKSESESRQQPLLHYALEHHMRSFVEGPPSSSGSSIVAKSATRGTMYGICQNASGDNNNSDVVTWEFMEPEDSNNNVRFDHTQAIDSNLVEEFHIDQHLRDEIGKSWEIPRDGSYYFNGKKMQQYASLCLMAHDNTLIQDHNGDTTALRQACLEKFAKLWDVFVSTDGSDPFVHPLVYDEVYKGIVSSEGFLKKDAGVDFGNTVYNDHHYHYGYWIVSASIFLHLHPTYPQRKCLEGRIEALIRDVANPNSKDPCFPKFRHFDWYLGHSYSHGVTPMADGKDQESVSEEMNLHYGLALWGELQASNLKAMGELMLKVNARAIQTYFFITHQNLEPKPVLSLETDSVISRSNSPIEAAIHPPEFLSNKVTGIFFDNKVDCTTWFSSDRCCIHGIQMIPVTPIIPLFRPLRFVEEEWEEVLSKLPMVQHPRDHPSPWQSILFTNYARIDKRIAMKHLEYAPMDDGLSRAWALYMAATTL